MMIDVFICTDASRLIGTGHLVRCLLLAEKLQKRGASIHFILKSSSTYAHDLTRSRQFSFSILPDHHFTHVSYLLDTIKKGKYTPKWLLIDSDEPGFYDLSFQDQIREQGVRLGMIVFKTGGVFHVDLLHNQNPLALTADYQTLANTEQLLGLRYVILKDEYAALQGQVDPEKSRRIDQVLINFGGVDIQNKTGRIVRLLLEHFPDWQLILVLGAMYDRVDELQGLLKGVAEDRYRIYVNTPAMPQLMAEADLAITGGGLTAWELGVLYTPNLVIPSSGREVQTAERLAELSLIYYFGPDGEVSDQELIQGLKAIEAEPEKRLGVVQRMASELDVNGADEVARIICEYG